MVFLVDILSLFCLIKDNSSSVILLSALRKDITIYFKYHATSCLEGLYTTCLALYLKICTQFVIAVIEKETSEQRNAAELKQFKNIMKQ